MSLLALADGAVLSHLLSAEERQAGVLAADGDLDVWARLADEGLPLMGGGRVRTRWALSPQELPRSASSALAGPDGWLEAFEDDTIVTLRLRGGALELGTLAEQQADEAEETEEEATKRLETVVEGCAGAAVERWRSVSLAPYEVSAVQPCVSVTMRPLLGGDLVCLADRSLSGSARRLTCWSPGCWTTELEANSVERLGDLQQQVLAAAPAARLVSESIVPTQELLAERWRDPKAGSGGWSRPRRRGGAVRLLDAGHSAR